MAGAMPVGVPLRLHGEGSKTRYILDTDELASAVTSRTRAVVLNTPHNPTGKVFTPSELRDICEVIERHDLMLFSDEPYEHLTFGNSTHLSPASLPGMWDRTVTISSAAKVRLIDRILRADGCQ